MSHKPQSLGHNRHLPLYSTQESFNEHQIPTGTLSCSKGKENQHQFSSPFQIFLPATFLSCHFLVWMTSCQNDSSAGRGRKHHCHLPAWAETLNTSSLKMPKPHWHPAWKIVSTPTTVLLAAVAAVTAIAARPISSSKESVDVKGTHWYY